MDADRVQRDLDETYSGISTGILSKAYSELTTISTFDNFYNKWEGIIKSGQNIENSDLHFFDQNAWLKLQKDDENLKVVKKLQHEINDLRLNHG